MPSSLRPRLLFLSIISVGCGDDGGSKPPIDAPGNCGPGGAPAAGITATGGSATLTYGNFTGGLNNDCPGAGSPVTSLTIAGTQTDGSGFLTLCVERPDMLAAGLALGSDVAGSPVHVVDFSGSAAGCTFAIDRTTGPSGTAEATGLCGNGSDSRGFALELTGTVPFTQTCGGTMTPVTLTLAGSAAIVATP